MRKSWFFLALLAAVPAVPVHAETVKVTREVCDQLVDQMPDADVNYRPGVDVNGNAVAPADLPSNAQIKVPDEFTIPIMVNLGPQSPGGSTLPAGGTGYFGQAQIGSVTYKNGQVYFNGQPLQAPDTAAIAEACKNLKRGQ